MGQGTDTWQSETHREGDRKSDSEKDESATGRNMPSGDGNVGDEQVNDVGNTSRKTQTGQDHSTEHHQITDPDHGVGDIQYREDTTSDAARIRD